jgi:outer membrane receptor protein involved in Fe transport
MTYELGWQALLMEKKFDMNTSVFYTHLKDPIFIGSSATQYLLGGITYQPIINNGTTDYMGLEWEATYKLSDRLMINSDYALIMANPDPSYDFAGGATRGQSLNLSNHQIGMGCDYTKNDLTLGVYFKWISKYIDAAEGTWKKPSYWKTTFRAAYAFKIPGMKMKEKDAEVELVVNDLMGAHVVESPHKYIRQPDVYAGVKVKF